MRTLPQSAAMQPVPSLTAVLPVWGDYVEYLPGAVAEARAQEGAATMVIIIDNASDRPMPHLGPDVDVIRAPERLTVGAARNLGLARVTTPYVTFYDVDDGLLPGTWRFLLDRLERRPELVLATTGAVKRNDSGETWRRHIPRSAYLLARVPKAMALLNVWFNVLMTNAGTVMRTDVVRRAGGFGDSNFGEDWSLSTVMAVEGPIEIHARPGFYWHIHGGSLWHRPQPVGEVLDAAEAVRARLRRHPATPWWVRAWLPVAPLALRCRLRRLAGGHDVIRPDARPPGAAS